MISTDVSLVTSFLLWNEMLRVLVLSGCGKKYRDLSFTSMNNTIFCSKLQIKMHNFPNYKFKSTAYQNTLGSSKRNWISKWLPQEMSSKKHHNKRLPVQFWQNNVLSLVWRGLCRKVHEISDVSETKGRQINVRKISNRYKLRSCITRSRHLSYFQQPYYQEKVISTFSLVYNLFPF